MQPHVALYLLQHCLWIPRFTYLLRCCPIFKFDNFLETMDNEIVNALEDLMNLQLNEFSHLQCFLPIKHGGLGIRLMKDIATPAFISSFNSSIDLINEILSSHFLNRNDKDYSDALNKWKLMFPSIDLPENVKLQEEWDLPNINNKLHLISESSFTARARLLALTQKESGGWLQTLPSPYLGSLLDSDSLRIASGIRLGAKICQPYTCVCGFPVDEYGTHGLSCISKKGTFSRHFNLNDLISKALSTAGFPNILEPRGLVRTDGKRADGLTITPWKNGKSLVWDATCVDTIASSYLHLTSKHPGAAANMACSKKEELYKDIVINHYFLPFAVETFGSFSDPAKKFVRNLGPILNSRSGNVRSASFFTQKISLAIQRGNVAGITGTIPANAKLDEIFYIH